MTVALSAQCDDGPAIIDIDTEPAHCGQNDGAIFISVAGGAGELIFTLNGLEPGMDSIRTGVYAGIYLVEVVDTTGCVDQQHIYVDDMPGVLISDVEVSVLECDSLAGMGASVKVAWVDEHFVEFSIDNVNWQSSSQLTGLPADTLTVYVRDHTGCHDEREIVIENPFPEVLGVFTDPSDCDTANGRAYISYWASKGPYLLSVDSVYFSDNPWPFAGPVVDGLPPGDHTLYVANDLGCVLAFDIDLGNYPEIRPEAVHVIPATCDAGGRIDVTTGPGIHDFSLSGSSGFIDLEPGTYLLNYVDTSGCSSDSLLLVRGMDCGVFVPNVFSPNGDGVNDLLEPSPPDGVGIVGLDIFNRWGGTVYSCQGNCSWDGKVSGTEVGSGHYVYLLKYRDVNGQEQLQSGDITVLR